jgi:TPR repeat protein
MHPLITALFLSTALVLVGCSRHQADLERGMAAYRKGDYAAALKELQPLAEDGNPQAQFQLGWTHREGQGLPSDAVQMAKWLRKSAEQGYMEAQFHLGELYARGIGVREHPAQALQWFLKAADQGHARSQFNAGEMYAYGGPGVKKDVVAAYALYSLPDKGDASLGNSKKSALSSLARKLSRDEVQAGKALASQMTSAGSSPSKVLAQR